MKDRPAAWMNKRTSKCVVFINTPPSDDWIPLYTTPQTKELSDKEIEQIGKKYGIESIYRFSYYEFARETLKKANEK